MTKISSLSDIGTSVASNDTFVLVDASDPTTPNKKIQQQNLFLIPDGSVATPGLRFLNDTDTGIYRSGSNTLGLVTGASTRLFIDSSGRVGIGTTSPAGALDVGAVSGAVTAGDLTVTTGSTTAKVTIGRLSSTGSDNTSFRIRDRVDRDVLTVDTNNFVYSQGGSERARIDSSGRLLVGTSTAVADASSLLQISSAGGPKLALNLQDGTVTSGQFAASIDFYSFGGFVNESIASIQASADGAHASGDKPGRLVFSTTADGASSPTERMRIANDGRTQFYANATAIGSYTNFGAGTTAAVFVGRHSATSTTTGTDSFRVYSNGNVVNTNDSYGALSDAKLKENIVDAGSQWDDFKAVRFRKYNFKEETGHETFTQLGVIAQELEQVCPGLVDETPDRDGEGNDLGTTTKSVKYSILTKKALVALQEAMDRIETLEAKVAALEAN